MVLAGVLLVAATIDIRWLKNRTRIISKVYVSPTFHALAPPASTAPGSGPFAQNDKLRDVSLIGLGRIEAPEDVILDRNDNLYAGSRHGDIMRFMAPDYKEMEVFAHIGGQPLGMAFDRNDNLYVCIGGMGLYRITPERKVEKVTDETNRSLYSVNDDSRLRLADDLDIADDGRIFFSEATVRYEMHEWPVDGLEARGNGRIICYDPNNDTTRTVLRGLKFPNGICIASDRKSILFAETFGCCIRRYWFDGEKAGTTEMVIDNLPGYPDNINLASDGNYWLAMVGMRSPALDLAWKMPGFRKRMGKRVPIDEWLFPNINTGCVIKFNERGEVLESFWDLRGENHPMITSMREHRGYLYLGGIMNNRIGRYKLEQCRPRLRPVRPALGEERMIGRPEGVRRPAARPRRGDHHRAVVRRRAEAEPDSRERRDRRAAGRARGSRDRRQGALRRRRRRDPPPRRHQRMTEVRRFDRADHRAVLPAGRRHGGRARRARGAGICDRHRRRPRARPFRTPR